MRRRVDDAVRDVPEVLRIPEALRVDKAEARATRGVEHLLRAVALSVDPAVHEPQAGAFRDADRIRRRGDPADENVTDSVDRNGGFIETALPVTSGGFIETALPASYFPFASIVMKYTASRVSMRTGPR